MSAVAAQGLTKTFHTHVALNDVSLRVEAAERFVILGPSGAGKSTLLRLLAGLEVPDSGSVFIGEQDVTSVPPHERALALIFQQGALFPHFDVYENLAFPLRTRGAGRARINERIEQIAPEFSLEPLLRRKVRGLSGGERERVAIARALLRDPQALLLDEPMGQLDPASRLLVRASLLEVARKHGRALVVVTHDHDEALRVADRLAILIEGRIAQCDVPARVYDFPASTAVARFLGPLAMNLLPRAGEALGYGAVTIGIRPQHISVGAQSAHIRGMVAASEFIGSAWLARVQTDFGMVTVRVPEAAPPLGENLQLHFPSEWVRRFDTQTGMLIA